MYRCKECGTEYKEKPDYCDCGNDEFEVINSNASENNIETKENLRETDIPKVKPAEIYGENSAEEIPKVRPAYADRKTTFNPPPQKKSFTEQYPGLNRLISSLDPISLVIFCVCLLLSLYIVFFAFNPSEQEIVQQEQKSVNVVAKDIPSIDKIWNNALPAYQQPEVKKELPEEKLINQIIQTVVPQKAVPKSSVQTQKPAQTAKQTSQPKIAKVTLQKTIQTSKPKTTPAQQKTQAAATTQPQKAADDTAKQKAEQERIAAEAAHLKQLQAVQTKKAAEEKAKQEAVNKQEYANYKVQLRNTIGRKIDFTRVIGDGSCTVAFKIDSTGKLTNRSFVKQSSNNTLNDEVYAAVMSTPSFNPPPASYNNETLNLSIKFYNGNFEISLQ